MSQDTTRTKSETIEDETRNALLQLLAREVVKRLKQQQAAPEHAEPVKDKVLEGNFPVKIRQNSMSGAH